MFAPLRQRDFALLLTGQLVSSLGDWLLFVALPFYIYELTGSTIAAGGMFVASTLPSLLFGSLAGVFVDRWDRQRTMVVADLLRAGLLLPMLLVHSPDAVWIIFVCTFVQATIGQFFGPARSALLPRLVPEAHLTAANSLSALSSEVTRLVGPAAGGALLALYGLPSVVVLDSLTFLFSSGMISLLRVSTGLRQGSTPVLVAAEAVAAAAGGNPGPAPDTAGRSAALAKVWRELREGLSVIRHNRVVGAVFLTMAVAMLGQGPTNALIVPLVKDVLGGGAVQFGWMMTAQGIGGIAGGLLVGKLGQRAQPGRLIAAGGVATGLLLLVAVNVRSLAVVMVLLALLGVPVMALNIPAQTLLQRSVEDHLRGRTFGAFGALVTLVMLISLAVASALAQVVGTVAVMDGSGVLFALSGVVAYFVIPGLPSAESASAPAGDRPQLGQTTDANGEPGPLGGISGPDVLGAEAEPALAPVTS